MTRAAPRPLPELDVLYRLTDALTRATTLSEIYAPALESLRDALGASRSSIMVFDPDGVMRFKAWREISDSYRRAVEGHSPWNRNTRDPQPISVPDVLQEPALEALREAIVGEGIRSLVFVPLVSSGTLLGKFMLYFNEPHELTPSELRLARTIAAHVAFGVERMRSQDAIRLSEEDLGDFFENAAIPLSWVGPDGTILRANNAELAMLGYPEDEYVGRRIEEFHVDPQGAQEMLRRLAKRETCQIEARLRCKNGSFRNVLITANVKWDGDRFLHTRCLTHDLTERHIAERRLAAEHAVTRILSESKTFAEAAPKILRSVAECLGCAVAGYWAPLPNGRTIACFEMLRIDSSGVDSASLESFERLRRRTRFERGIGLPGRVWDSGEPAWISDLSSDPDFPRLQAASGVGLASGFAFPIQVDGRTRGLMEFFFAHRTEPEARLLQMMSAIGSEIGQFIERRQVEAVLSEREQRFRLMAETIPEILFTSDGSGNLLYVSPRFYEYTGGTPDTFTPGRLQFVHPDDQEAAAAHWKSSIERSEIFDMEYRMRRKDGAYRWYHCRMAPILDERGNVQLWFGIAMDIHEQRLAREKLQEASRAKDDFLAMLAHELRNPLNPIRNAVHIMKLVDSGDPAFEQSRDIIDRQVGHMTRLIDDLLDVSRIARGKILLRRERVDLVSVVRATLDDNQAEIEARGITLFVDLWSQPLPVSGDPTRLAQIIGNVLHNAAKFTDRGGQITVRTYPDPEMNHGIVRVRDTGVGIDPEILSRVFDTFTQADQTLDRSSGGLGLGLPLVKGFVQLHGGTVTASSEGIGRGAEFTIRLPLDTHLAEAASPSVSAAPEGATCRVLLIEDNSDSVESTRLYLHLKGHEVEVAYTGAAGLAKARDCRPDVVLCDIGLQGGMDGYAVARALRSTPDFAGTYLVAVTGYGREEDIRSAREAGFDLHLTKPVDPTALQTLLAAIASRLPAIRS